MVACFRSLRVLLYVFRMANGIDSYQRWRYGGRSVSPCVFGELVVDIRILSSVG